MSNPHMSTIRSFIIAAALALAGCASVSTNIVELNPAQKYAPTVNVEVLLQKPARPHVEIALIESRGGSEAELLNDAREKARALGADAIVRLEVERIYYAPLPVYDPWFDPFWGYYRYPFAPLGPYPYGWGPYRYVGGGFSYVLKTSAIRYTDRDTTPAQS